MWTMIWLVSTIYASNDSQEATDHLVPATWSGNPWGPEANLARQNGTLPQVEATPQMKQWDDWGRKFLKDGDIVFRLGDARILAGWFPMSRFLANVSGSQFSHTGIVERVNGDAWVYDMTNYGPRFQPFSVWMLDNVGAFGVKRPKPQYASYIPKALEYCKNVYLRKVPFDYDLGTDDSALYCLELTEKAYRANGLPLAEPVKLGDMENIGRYPITVMGFLKFTPLTLDLPVIFPGNSRHGIWSSRNLATVYAPPPPADPNRPAGDGRSVREMKARTQHPTVASTTQATRTASNTPTPAPRGEAPPSPSRPN
jgi:hypothetical protein